MKRNVLKRWMIGIAMPLLSLVLVPGLCLAGNGDSYFKKGTRLLKQAKPDQAVVALTEAIRLAPDRVEAYANRGLAYLEEKKYGQAKQDFLKALAIAPDDVKANNNLGVFYCGREDYDSALRYLRRATGAHTLSGPYGAVVYRNLGFIYTKKGMTEEAEDAYEKARGIQAKASGDLDLRPYGESSRDYALTLEFKSQRDQAK
jgi:Tfp pilus assembly protein PilF